VALCHDMIMIYMRIICFLCFEGTHVNQKKLSVVSML